MKPAPKVIVLCFGEDKDPAAEVLRALVKALVVRVIQPGTWSQFLDIRPIDAAHRPAVVANAWMSGSPRDQAKITEFNKYVATQLKVRGPFTLTIHHFDADEQWKPGHPCARLVLWQKVVLDRVRHFVGPELGARLVPLVPIPRSRHGYT